MYVIYTIDIALYSSLCTSVAFETNPQTLGTSWQL